MKKLTDLPKWATVALLESMPFIFTRDYVVVIEMASIPAENRKPNVPIYLILSLDHYYVVTQDGVYSIPNVVRPLTDKEPQIDLDINLIFSMTSNAQTAFIEEVHPLFTRVNEDETHQ